MMALFNHLFGIKGPSGFGSSTTADQVVDTFSAPGKGTSRVGGATVIVTGCNCGIGKETVRALARLEPKLIVMACRDMDKAKAAAEEILEANPGANLKPMNLDVSSMASVRQFAKDFKSSKEGKSLNLLVNNAGVMMCPKILTDEGFELQLATNHLGHFLLTNLLMDTLKETAKREKRRSRVVIVASGIHPMAPKGAIDFDDLDASKSYGPVVRYAQSKIANMLHAIELSRRLEEEGAMVDCASLHPGAIPTELQRWAIKGMPKVVENVLSVLAAPLMKSIPQGAATSLYLATADPLPRPGAYYADCNVAAATSDGKDPEIARRLWEVSEKLVRKK